MALITVKVSKPGTADVLDLDFTSRKEAEETARQLRRKGLEAEVPWGTVIHTKADDAVASALAFFHIEK